MLMQGKFSIIGSGNMAWFLAEKLSSAGYEFEGIYGRNIQAANDIALAFSTTVYSALAKLPDAENHYCFIAVKDTAIVEIASQLKFKHTTLIHTAGASSIKLIGGAAQNYGAIWPIYSIVKTNHLLPKNIPVAVEGNNKATENEVLKLAKTISEEAFIATEKQRLNLHLAAVFANNFTNHLLAIAEDICTHENITFDYLNPILNQTFKRLETQSAKKSQTGPALRGDEITLQQHLLLLEGNSTLTQLYQTLSMSIRKMYENEVK